MNVRNFWGKAQPCDPDRGPEWHPLAFHCLDVAAVGEVLLTRHRGLGSHLPCLLGLPGEHALRLVSFLLSLHDIGKFAKKFQAKVPNLYLNLDCFDDDPARLAGIYDHGAGGLRLFDSDGDFFELLGGIRSNAWRPLISAVTGHHGAPPAPRMNETIVTLRSDFGAPGIEAARAFICQVYELFSLPPELPPPTRANARRASFALAGLAVLADWIGSKQEWFPYRERDDFEDLETYFGYAREQANRAIAEAGVLPASISDCLGYDALIGAEKTPSPMQDWARKVELPAGPALYMIEDETGSGKTETALMLAHRLMAACRAEGLYIALPTMATANAMFDRLCTAQRKLFAAGAAPSVALAHGARDLHQGFRSAVLRGGRAEDSYSGAGGQGEESETTASAACAAWIADDRRRTFLADVGAGTVDQALLSVLPSRHQSLRLLGLMRRILVLDEVHAYDAYMQREIETLLEFQAGLGGSAILLSATLPLAFRKRLADAFSKGLGKHTNVAETNGTSMHYPLATVRATGVRTSIKVPGRVGRARALPVRFLRTTDEALDEVENAARDGKATLYIRNTVDDALDAHAALTARGLSPCLFHARYAFTDRLKKENRIVQAFGKDSGIDHRTWPVEHPTVTPPVIKRMGKILVATQVVEQSLDLDFDAMISDLAPVDLLIQRAGRLWRHDRRERKGLPELLVVTPPPLDDANEDWFKTAFPRAAYVYRDHARLWLTARLLEETGGIESPGGLRSLIEAVYGDEAEVRVPNGLVASLFDAEGRAGAERGIATTNVLAFAKGYVRDGGAWDSDVRTPTRLDDDPQVTLRLAQVQGGRIEPYAHDHEFGLDQWRAWRLSEVNVTRRRVSGEALPPDHAEAARAAKADWTRFDEKKIMIVLEKSVQSALSGVVLDGTGNSKEVTITYSQERGLTFG